MMSIIDSPLHNPSKPRTHIGEREPNRAKKYQVRIRQPCDEERRRGEGGDEIFILTETLGLAHSEGLLILLSLTLHLQIRRGTVLSCIGNKTPHLSSSRAGQRERDNRQISRSVFSVARARGGR